VLSTYWLSAKEHCSEVQQQLAEKGFEVADITSRSRQRGLWISVRHDADQTLDVLAIVTRVDPGAALET
jgi:hypothetical protein